MSSEKCKCPLAIRLTGEGCRYCQPQNYIEHLVDQYDDTANELDAANFEIDRLKRQVEVLLIGLKGISGRCTPEAQLVLNNALAAAAIIAKE